LDRLQEAVFAVVLEALCQLVCMQDTPPNNNWVLQSVGMLDSDFKARTLLPWVHMQVIQARVLAQSQLVEFLVAMHKDLLQLRLVTLLHATVKMVTQSP
jgi:hypothetical protein